jgi:hypothetical protein
MAGENACHGRRFDIVKPRHLGSGLASVMTPSTLVGAPRCRAFCATDLARGAESACIVPILGDLRSTFCDRSLRGSLQAFFQALP